MKFVRKPNEDPGERRGNFWENILAGEGQQVKVEIAGKYYYDLEELTKFLSEAISRRRNTLDEVKGLLDIVERHGHDISMLYAPVKEARKTRRRIFIGELIIAGCLFLVLGGLLYRLEAKNRSNPEVSPKMSAQALATQEKQKRLLEANSQTVAELEKKVRVLREGKAVNVLAAQERQERQLEAYSRKIAKLEKEVQVLRGENTEEKKPQSSNRKIYVLKKNPPE